MNSLFIVLSIVAAVVAQPPEGERHHHGGPPMKGCENPPTNPPKLSECCAGFPKFYSKEIMKANCSSTCGEAKGPSGFCCKSDCMLNTFGVLTNGKFDATKAKAAIAQLTANSSTVWSSDLISSIVDGCVQKAPEIVANITAEKAANGGNGPDCTADQTSNMVIGHCIRREMFFQCPGLSTSEQCTALVTFGKSCPRFPFHHGCHDNVNKAAKKGGKKGKEGKVELSLKKILATLQQLS